MCSTTNAATAPSSGATTCAAGSESIGANFNIPKAGWYEACFDFSQGIQVDLSEQVYTIFNVIQTPTNAQTLTFEGGPRKQGGTTGMNIAAGADSIIYFPRRECGQINFTSAGNVGVRLMFEQAVFGTPDASVLVADADANQGQRAIRVTVKPLLTPSNSPATINSVMNSSSGTTRIESATVTCSASSSIIAQHGVSWVSSIGNISSGICTATLVTGKFSSTPFCVGTWRGDGANQYISVLPASATSVGMYAYTSAGAASTLFSINLWCMGPK